MNKLLNLFWTCTYLGAQMFGTGFAVMPLLEKEFAEKRGWVSKDELAEYASISACIPGAYTVSIIAFIGNKRAGFLGGMMASVGVVIIPVATIVFFVLFYNFISEAEALEGVFVGISVAVSALIFKFIITLWKNAVVSFPTFIVLAVSLLLFMFTDISIVFILLGMSFIYCLYKIWWNLPG